MSKITFKKRAASEIGTPVSGKVTFFIDSADGLPKYKNSDSSLGSFVGPQGAQGIQGNTGNTGAAGTNGSNGANGTSGFVPIKTSLTSVFTGAASNVTAQTVLTLSIPANTLSAGNAFSIEAVGTQSQSAAANNVTFDVILNGATVIAQGVVAGGVSAQTNRGCQFSAQVTFHGVGSSGSAIGTGTLTVSGVLPVMTSPAVTGTTVNTTSTVTLALRVTNSTSNAANIIRVTSAYLTQAV